MPYRCALSMWQEGKTAAQVAAVVRTELTENLEYVLYAEAGSDERQWQRCRMGL